MPSASNARLQDRSVIRVSGADAAKLLGSVITNDISLLDRAPAFFAGLLTPQGKIIADFLIARESGDGFLIDVARDRCADVVQKLKLYRLRAKAEIEPAETAAVYATWGGDAAAVGEGVGFSDPRLSALGHRVIATSALSETATPEAYHSHRITLGIPEGGKDYGFGEAFPHEALFDQLHGVSFTKGCYVGQEIVSRMEHRGTARTRIVTVSSDQDLPADRPEVRIGDVPIGRLGSVAGTRGLALLRVDRAAEAISKGDPLTIDGHPVTVAPPAYATFALAPPPA